MSAITRQTKTTTYVVKYDFLLPQPFVIFRQDHLIPQDRSQCEDWGIQDASLLPSSMPSSSEGFLVSICPEWPQTVCSSACKQEVSMDTERKLTIEHVGITCLRTNSEVHYLPHLWSYNLSATTRKISRFVTHDVLIGRPQILVHPLLLVQHQSYILLLVVIFRLVWN